MPNQWNEQDWKVIRGCAAYIRQFKHDTAALQRGVQRWKDRRDTYEMLVEPSCSVAAAEYILSLYVAALLRAEE